MMTDNYSRHGEYDPSRGWYDASLKAWVRTPDKLTRIVRADDAEHLRGEWEEMQNKGKRFNTVPHLERLLTLRDSDRPEDREAANKILAGSQRVALARYEEQRKAHIANGGEVA